MLRAVFAPISRRSALDMQVTCPPILGQFRLEVVVGKSWLSHMRGCTIDPSLSRLPTFPASHFSARELSSPPTMGTPRDSNLFASRHNSLSP